MGWLRRHPPAHSNGHSVYRYRLVPEVLPNVSDWTRVSNIPPLVLIPQPTPPPIFRRSDRHADDNYYSPGVGSREVELIARAARTGRPQRLHDHPYGVLCTPRCEVLG